MLMGNDVLRTPCVVRGGGRYTGLAVTPFGSRNARSGSLVSGFAGLLMERGGCGYLPGNGRRLYLPAPMRFAQPDGLSPFGAGGVNAYSYCGAEPVNRVDRNGGYLTLVTLLATAFANLVGAATVAVRTAGNVVGDLAAGGMAPGVSRLRRARDVLGIAGQGGNLATRGQQVPGVVGLQWPEDVMAVSANISATASQFTVGITNAANVGDAIGVVRRRVAEHGLGWGEVLRETAAEVSGYNLLTNRPRSGRLRTVPEELREVVVQAPQPGNQMRAARPRLQMMVYR